MRRRRISRRLCTHLCVATIGGPRDLDNRSRRARQGRVTVHRMKVTRIIHGPVFLSGQTIEKYCRLGTLRGNWERELGRGEAATAKRGWGQPFHLPV